MEIEESIALFVNSIKASKKTEKVYITEALQRVAANIIYAPMAVPNFPKSAMDGYAVRAVDTVGASTDKPVALKVIGKLYAGDNINLAYEPASCLRIMTGAYIPEGFDAVVKQEHTDYGKEECLIYKSVSVYENYCHIGEDIQNGQILIPAGTLIQPFHLGLLASCGIDTVEVMAPLKVAILTSGSELYPLGKELEYGKIYNSIGYVLQGTLHKQGIKVVACEQCEDDELKLSQCLTDMLEKADFVITTGGISVGEKDLLPSVLASMQGKIVFAKANIQPGASTQAWLVQDKPVLCLSGNPYAAYANFELYFWEAAAKFLACGDMKVEVRSAILKHAVTKRFKRRRLLRGAFEDGYVTIPESKHLASAISDLNSCNCFVEVNPEQSLAAGQKVTIRLFK